MEEKNIEQIIEDLDNETENSMKVALKTVLLELVRMRKLLENKKCGCQKVYTQPTDNPEDIIVGRTNENTDGYIIGNKE